MVADVLFSHDRYNGTPFQYRKSGALVAVAAPHLRSGSGSCCSSNSQPLSKLDAEGERGKRGAL
jgi:hypothetical protein